MSQHTLEDPVPEAIWEQMAPFIRQWFEGKESVTFRQLGHKLLRAGGDTPGMVKLIQCVAPDARSEAILDARETVEDALGSAEHRRLMALEAKEFREWCEENRERLDRAKEEYDKLFGGD